MEAELGYRGNLKRLGLRAFALIAVFLRSGLFTRAQEFPRWECFGGFSYATWGWVLRRIYLGREQELLMASIWV